MEKPKPYIPEPEIKYNDVINWIEQKYGYDSRDYAGHFKDRTQPYQDFWHWLLDADMMDVYNGKTSYLRIDEWLENGQTPDWVKRILTDIKAEFGEHMKEGMLNVMMFW